MGHDTSWLRANPHLDQARLSRARASHARKTQAGTAVSGVASRELFDVNPTF
jgi:hypothetical protein